MRYVQNPPEFSKRLRKRVEQDALTLCRAVGYDRNTVEFAVEKGVPYAIDFMNPAPDADLHSVGRANFEWIVREVADLAIAKAKQAPQHLDMNWSAFLKMQPAAKKASPKKSTASKKSGAKRSIARKQKNSSPLVSEQ